MWTHLSGGIKLDAAYYLHRGNGPNANGLIGPTNTFGFIETGVVLTAPALANG